MTATQQSTFQERIQVLRNELKDFGKLYEKVNATSHHARRRLKLNGKVQSRITAEFTNLRKLHAEFQRLIDETELQAHALERGATSRARRSKVGEKLLQIGQKLESASQRLERIAEEIDKLSLRATLCSPKDPEPDPPDTPAPPHPEPVLPPRQNTDSPNNDPQPDDDPPLPDPPMHTEA